MVGPGKSFVRRAVPAKEVGLPGSHICNARNFVTFGLVRYGIGGLPSARGHQQIDFLFKNYVSCDLSSPVCIRLAILADNLDFVAYPAVSNSFGQHSANLVEDKWISLGKRGECPGLRADMADLDYFRTSNFGARSAQNHGSGDSGCAEAFNYIAAPP